MRIAVLGSTGMLGSMLKNRVGKHFTMETPKFDAITITRNELAYQLQHCGWVINAIGAIPQRCTDDFKFWKLNACFPAKLEKAAQVIGFNVIQIATDCVYNGKRGDYTEADAISPVDVYAQSKAQGEIESDFMYHIRCSIIGPEVHGKSLLGWFLNQPKGAKINGYTNHVWNGVTTLQFANICMRIIDAEIPMPHIQHLVPADAMTKHELLKLFAKVFKRKDIKIIPVEANEGINRTLATTRPSLNSTLWQSIGYQELPTIEQMVRELAEYMENNQEGTR